MAPIRFPIEGGHILTFARATGDTDPAYYAVLDGVAAVAPPTFVWAVAQFDPEFPLRPGPGRPWMGSGRDATGTPQDARPPLLHAEQRFDYHRPCRAGDVLTATQRDGSSWEKQGRRGGQLAFREVITEYRDQQGDLVVTSTTVFVQPEQVVASER